MTKCTFCGFEYNPAEHPSCGTCPLHSGCSMTCCPNCGISNINPAESRLASWIKNLIPGGKYNAKPTLSEERTSN